MSDDETKTAVGGQSGELTSNGDSTNGESTAEGIRKKTSKTRSTWDKSSTNIRREKSDPNVSNNGVGSETLNTVELIERIEAVPVVAVGRLKDSYYRDLRSLLPPTDLPESRRGAEGAVNGILRGVHEAIDEIEQWLNNMVLSIECNDAAAGTLLENMCVNRPFKLYKPKLDDPSVAMKTYRVANDDASPRGGKSAVLKST